VITIHIPVASEKYAINIRSPSPPCIGGNVYSIVVVTILVCMLLPSVASLIGMLMLGNLFRESGVVERLNNTVQNELINIVTIFLGVTVGATAVAETFLRPETFKIIVLGLMAFIFSTMGGLAVG